MRSYHFSYEVHSLQSMHIVVVILDTHLDLILGIFFVDPIRLPILLVRHWGCCL